MARWPSAEAQWVRHGLSDEPLVGFFAAGEIAHAGLHGYTGALTVFMKTYTEASAAQAPDRLLLDEPAQP